MNLSEDMYSRSSEASPVNHYHPAYCAGMLAVLLCSNFCFAFRDAKNLTLTIIKARLTLLCPYSIRSTIMVDETVKTSGLGEDEPEVELEASR